MVPPRASIIWRHRCGSCDPAEAVAPSESAIDASEGSEQCRAGVDIARSGAMAEQAPEERGAPQADMALSRALDGINETGSRTGGPQTRTTDPMVIASIRHGWLTRFGVL